MRDAFQIWVDAVCEQVRFRPDRKAIAQELRVHYDDHVKDLLRLGRDPALAEERALAAMGDAWDNADDRVFTKEDGTPLFPDSISKWFTTFVKRSGLPPVTVHSLRHTYASLMIAEGTPLVNVSHSLGHAQVSTTTNIYAHVIAAAEARAAAVSDRFSDAVIKLTPGMKPKERKKAAGG